MSEKNSQMAPADIRRVQRQFKLWRKGKKGRERIPPALWKAAAKLCETYSTHRVARWLRLNHTALRQRTKETGSAGSRASPTFIEWAPSAYLPAMAECLLEVGRTGERTLRVITRGVGVEEVARLALALQRQEPRG